MLGLGFTTQHPSSRFKVAIQKSLLPFFFFKLSFKIHVISSIHFNFSDVCVTHQPSIAICEILDDLAQT